MARSIGQSSLLRSVARFLGIEPGEFAAVAWSVVFFFCVLSSYYMLRPVRESMAVGGGWDNIPWLFTGTFFFMVLATLTFGWVTSRYLRRQFLPWVYYFFIANILMFYVAFLVAENGALDKVWVGRAFFVWISVFNLFIVSVFWSFMADIYNQEQARRVFGFISAGGSIGAILGPLLTRLLVLHIGTENMLPLAAALLIGAVISVHRLRKWTHQEVDEDGKPLADQPIGGSAWAGLKIVVTTKYFAFIAIVMVCGNFLGAALYMYMARLVSETYAGTDEYTHFYALIDTLTNVGSFIGQLLLVRHSVRRLGIGTTLALLPVVSMVGFALLAMNPVITVMAVFQVIRRSLTFGFTKPASDMLYGVVSKEAKYKAKNFIETAVYRGGDLFSTWTIKYLGAIGLSGISLVCIPIAILWTVLSFRIGREYQRRDYAISIGGNP